MWPKNAIGSRGNVDELASREVSDLAIVNHIARIALEDLEPRPMLQRIVQTLRDHLGCEYVSCSRLNLRERTLVCEALTSTIPTQVHIGFEREYGTGIIGATAMTGRTHLVADARAQANFIEATPHIRSELCVPIRHAGEVIAVINAESTRVNAFANRQSLLETVAEQIAGAIAAARLHQELRQRVALLGMMSELLRSAVDAGDLSMTLERIVIFVLERFKLKLCAILLVYEDEPERLLLKAEAGESLLVAQSVPEWPSRMGITGRAFRTGKAQFVPDVSIDPDYVTGNPEVRAEYVVPFRFRDRLLGLIDMESTSVDSFSDENRSMLDALAAQVAGAIHLTSTNERLLATNREVAEKSEQLEKANAQLREANEALQRLSNLDGLTGIANRRRFEQALRREWRRAQRHSHGLALLLIDIDDFKAYNDNYGHLAGDDCLKRVAATLCDTLQRPDDLIARYGGEEFAVLLPETDIKRALHWAETLRSAVAALRVPHQFARSADHLSISIGAASIVPAIDQLAADFVDIVDRALYRAKSAGRNCVAAA